MSKEYTIKVTLTDEQKEKGEINFISANTKEAKSLDKTLRAAGYTPEVSMVEKVDFNAPKRELTDKQKQAIEKRKAAGGYKGKSKGKGKKS